MKLYEAIGELKRCGKGKAFAVPLDLYLWSNVYALDERDGTLIHSSFYYACTDCYWFLISFNGYDADHTHKILMENEYEIVYSIKDMLKKFELYCISETLKDNKWNIEDTFNRRIKRAIQKKLITKEEGMEIVNDYYEHVRRS